MAFHEAGSLKFVTDKGDVGRITTDPSRQLAHWDRRLARIERPEYPGHGFGEVEVLQHAP